MSNLNWCTYCDNAINPYSESLYCSKRCLQADALRSHPLLGYNWHEFEDFPRPSCTSSNSRLSSTRSLTHLPSLTTSSSTSSSSSSALQQPPSSHFDFLLLSTGNHVTTNKATSLTHAAKHKP